MGLWSWKKRTEMEKEKNIWRRIVCGGEEKRRRKGRKEKEYTFLGGGGKRGKYFVNENLWFVEEKRTEREMEENIWRRKIYGLQRKRKTKKEKEENSWSGEEEKTAEGKGGKYFGEGKIVGQMEEQIGSIVYFKFTFSSNKCSLPCLVVDRMGELIVELMSVENVWCRWESWSFMHLSHRGMVGFGLGRKGWLAIAKLKPLSLEKSTPPSLFHLRRSKSYWR